MNEKTKELYLQFANIEFQEKVELLQNECHNCVDIMQRINPKLSYDSALSLYYKFKLADLYIKIEKLEEELKLKKKEENRI